MRVLLLQPDLPRRIREDLPLNKYDRTSFYVPGEPKGYIDYPFSEEFQQTDEYKKLQKALL